MVRFLIKLVAFITLAVGVTVGGQLLVALAFAKMLVAFIPSLGFGSATTISAITVGFSAVLLAMFAAITTILDLNDSDEDSSEKEQFSDFEFEGQWSANDVAELLVGRVRDRAVWREDQFDDGLAEETSAERPRSSFKRKRSRPSGKRSRQGRK